MSPIVDACSARLPGSEFPMEILRINPKPPIGLAFEISDLILLQGWAEFHNVHMVVELDHWVEGEEYEEVIAFYAKGSPLRRCNLWRSASDMVLPPVDRPRPPLRLDHRSTGQHDRVIGAKA